MKTKFFKIVLPALAFLFAITLSSFTPNEETLSGYIQVLGVWQPVTVDCQDNSTEFCLEQGQIVYKEQNTDNPIKKTLQQ